MCLLPLLLPSVCVRRRFCELPGHGLVCVCVFLFLSQARALSLSVFRFSHTVSVSRNCSPFLLALISTSIWLLLPESIIFFYYVFLLPLICNNSCILRDATVCVFLCLLSAQYRRGRFCPIVPACLRVCLVCCLWGGVILFTCNSSIGFLLVVGVAELFFYY